MSVAMNHQVLEKKPKDELKRIYNNLHGIVPGVVLVGDRDRLSKTELIERLATVKNIRPRHLAVVHNSSPFAVRDYLRRAARREGLDHMLNRPWKLQGLEYVILFGKRINAEFKVGDKDTSGVPEESTQEVDEGHPGEHVAEEPMRA